MASAVQSRWNENEKGNDRSGRIGIPSGRSKTIHSPLREEPNASDAVSGRFGVIRKIAVPAGRLRDDSR
jgi:hypothetical protein